MHVILLDTSGICGMNFKAMNTPSVHYNYVGKHIGA